jgi:hypothetical protein
MLSQSSIGFEKREAKGRKTVDMTCRKQLNQLRIDKSIASTGLFPDTVVYHLLNANLLCIVGAHDPVVKRSGS